MSSLPRIMIGVVGVRVIGDCDPIRPAIRHSVPSSRYQKVVCRYGLVERSGFRNLCHFLKLYLIPMYTTKYFRCEIKIQAIYINSSIDTYVGHILIISFETM